MQTWDQVSAWDSIAPGAAAPSGQVIITIITAAIRCRMSGHCGPSQGIKRSRRFYEQIHSTQQIKHELFWWNLAAFYLIICPSSWWEILGIIKSGKIEMIWTRHKRNNDSSDKKISLQNICLLNNDDRGKRSQWQTRSVKLIIMPQQTLDCSPSVSGTNVTHGKNKHSLFGTEPRISQSWLEIVYAHVIMLCVYLVMCLSSEVGPARERSKKRVKVNKSWCYESWSIITAFLPRIMADLTWQKQPHFM